MTTPEEVKEDIAVHRLELAQTVDLLSQKLSVKHQAKAHQTQIAAGAGALALLLVVLTLRKRS